MILLIRTLPPFLYSLYQIALIVFSYTLLGGIYLHIWQGVSLLIVYPFMVFAIYCAYTPLHEGTHRSISSNKFINDALGTISGFLLVPCQYACISILTFSTSQICRR